MNTTNYHHCEKCDKYYHSDYWWLYHQESKHSGTDEIEKRANARALKQANKVAKMMGF